MKLERFPSEASREKPQVFSDRGGCSVLGDADRHLR